MNKLPFAILLLLLVGVAGVFLVWTDADEPRAFVDDVPMSWDDESDPFEPTEIAPMADPDLAPEDLDVDLPEGLDTIARREVEADDGAPRYLVVQVWKGEKGVPAVAVEVFFLDGFKGSELGDPYAQHWSSLAESRGQKFETDAAGRVQLPPVKDWAMVTAQGVGTYGFAKVGRKHRRVETILLQSDETVTVRVVDDQDQPVAGVPVGVAQRLPMPQGAKKSADLWARLKALEKSAASARRALREKPAQRAAVMAKMNGIRQKQRRVKAELGRLKGRGKRPKRAAPKSPRAVPKATTKIELRARRRTDAAGLAVFRHFQIYRRGPLKWWPRQHVDQFQAVLLMPLRQAQAVPFAGRPVPTETLELRLPPTGSIVLRTVDLDGHPFTHPVHADLRLHEVESPPWARLRQRKPQNQTEIVFPFVGLGLQFTARCRLDDDDFRWTLPPFAGPTSAGEQLRIDVVVAPSAGMLRGRLLDSDSNPLAGARPTFLINSGAGRLEGEKIALDQDGRFHLPYLVRQKHRGPFRLEIRHDQAKPIAGLVLALPRIPAGRITELGDLRLEGLGRIVFGTVTDDLGKPLRGAVVQLQRQRDVGGDKPRLAFVDEAFVSDRCDAEGGFDLFGTLEPGRYQLRVQARNHFPQQSRDLRGGEPLDLRLLRNSKLVGTVLTPSWLPSHQLKLTLQSAVDPRQRRQDQVRDYQGKKYIYFDRVRPGLYSLLVRVPEFPDPILRLDGIEIRPGQTQLHPRLANLDLGIRLHRFEITAIDENHRAIRPDWPLLARILRPDGQTAVLGFPWRGAKLQILSTSPDLEVLPFADGYQADPVVLAAGVSELRFRKIPPVVLHLPGLRRQLGETRAWIALRLQPGSGPAGPKLPRQLQVWDRRSKQISDMVARKRRRQAGKLLGSGDLLQLPVMVSGRYKVMAYLLTSSKARRTRPVAVELGAVDIRVVPGSGPQRVVVRGEVEKLRRGLAELAQREASGAGRKRRP